MKITAKKINPYLQAFIILTALACGSYAFLFLKTYFYPAITGSQTIIGLQKNMASQTISLSEFNELIKNIDKKTAPEAQPLPIGNPF